MDKDKLQKSVGALQECLIGPYDDEQLNPALEILFKVVNK